MRRPLLFIVLLLASATALAAKAKKNEDAPLPYDEQQQNSDDDERRRDLPKRSDETRERPSETQVEQDDRMVSLASDDDPNIGLSIEVVLGTNLLAQTRGGGLDGWFLGGFRFTWEWSRTLLSDEFIRELFFADVTWFASSLGMSQGTQLIRDGVAYHYFTLAPAVALPLGKTPLAVYGQVGVGVNWQKSSIAIADMQTDVSVVRFVFQYGLGVRARFLFVDDAYIREHGYHGIPALTLRLELTRFRRGYMDDTMVGGSVGITF